MRNLNIVITREIFNDKAIIGQLKIYDADDEDKEIFTCRTLENPKIGAEKNKDLAIPYGDYKLFLHSSSRFIGGLHKMLDSSYSMIGVYNDEVPKERYILIHWGNTEKDTLGCILLGESIMDNNNHTITQSRKTCRAFYQLLGNSIENVNLTITK